MHEHLMNLVIAMGRPLIRASLGHTLHGSDLRALHVTVIYSGYFIGSRSSIARVYGLPESRVNLLIANSTVISGNNELIHFFTVLRYIVA